MYAYPMVKSQPGMHRATTLLPYLFLGALAMMPCAVVAQQKDAQKITIQRDTARPAPRVVDTSRVLPLIQIWERKTESPRPAALVPTSDSLLRRMQPGSDLGNDLQWSSPLAVHSRGPGQLSTVAAGGLPSTHLVVTWEGMSLVNPMNQTPDWALMPSWLGSGAQLETRAAGGRISGGSGGGVLWIPSDDHWGNAPFSMFLASGSFGARSAGVGTALNRKGLSYRLRSYAQHTDLDFPYPTTSGPDAPLERRKNAAQSGAGLRQQLGFQWRRHHFRLGHWMQMHHRQLPAASTATEARAVQGDTLHRLGLNWHYTQGRHLFWGNLGTNRDDNHYRDSSAGVYGQHRVGALQAWLGWRRDGTNHWMNSHLQFQNHGVRSSAYPGRVHQTRLSFQSLIGKQWGRHTLHMAMRVEQVDGRWLAPVPEISWSAPSTSARRRAVNRIQEPTQSSQIPSAAHHNSAEDVGQLGPFPKVARQVSGSWSASLSGLQRIPGLNDLYWQPGGRTDLGNEVGWSVQVVRSHSWSAPTQRTRVRLNARLFANQLKRPIVWLPDATAGYWRPTSLQETRSGGLMIDATARRSLRNSILETQIQYAYTNSLQLPNRRSLPYLPPHVVLVTVRNMHPKRFVDLRLRVVDRRPDAIDPNDNRLKPYAILRWGAGWRLPGKAQRWNLSASVDNLLNARYELVPYHPMPGRQLNVSLLFE